MQSRIKGFSRLDIKVLVPFFTRRFTQQVCSFFALSITNDIEIPFTDLSFLFPLFQELKDCKTQMNDLTNQWYQTIRLSPTETDDEAPLPVLSPSQNPCGV